MRPGTIWKHKKTGRVYTIVGECQLEATNEQGVLYVGEDGGPIWARSRAEFTDGRFEPMPRLGPEVRIGT